MPFSSVITDRSVVSVKVPFWLLLNTRLLPKSAASRMSGQPSLLMSTKFAAKSESTKPNRPAVKLTSVKLALPSFWKSDPMALLPPSIQWAT